jgi:hypothetical protein
MLFEDNQIIDGCVFSSVGGIVTTQFGLALSNSLKNKTGIKLWGSFENNNRKHNRFSNVASFTSNLIYIKKRHLIFLQL